MVYSAHITPYCLDARPQTCVYACIPTVCPIAFSPEQYSVAEDVQGGTVEVCLMVARNCIGAFSVMLQNNDGTATGHFKLTVFVYM